MAFRRPIKLDGGNLRNMTDAEILLLQQEAIRIYGSNPSTSLSYDNGNGNLANIPDYRLQASEAAVGGAPWPTPGSATTVTVNYQHTLLNRVLAPFQNRGPTAYGAMSYPVYFDVDNNIRAMTWKDFNDTILTPAKDYLITNEGTDDNLYRAGTYTIHTTTSLTGCTLVDPNPIFTDTQADVSGFASGSIPEPQDQPVTVQNYYLHRFNPVDGIDFVPPVITTLGDVNLQSMPSNLFQALVSNDMPYNVDYGVDYGNTQTKFITYQYWPTSGAGAAALPGATADVRGSSMANTFTSSQTIRYEQPYGGSYYSQSVPSGTPTAYTTWNLIISYIDGANNYQ